MQAGSPALGVDTLLLRLLHHLGGDPAFELRRFAHSGFLPARLGGVGVGAASACMRSSEMMRRNASLSAEITRLRERSGSIQRRSSSTSWVSTIGGPSLVVGAGVFGRFVGAMWPS